MITFATYLTMITMQDGELINKSASLIENCKINVRK